MKLRSIIFFLLSGLLFLNSCNSSYRDREYSPPKPIEYAVIQKSPLFNKKNILFSIDSLNNIIFIKLHFNDLKNFPFPINYQYKDTLCNTSFNFDLTCNGKTIVSDYHSLNNTLRWKIDSSSTANNLNVNTDTIYLRNGNDIEVQIPFYAFHNLKKGKQTIELSMSQSVFTDQVEIMRKDSSYDHAHVYAKKSLLNAKVKFDINVPEIYKSIVYGMGLELKNDSTFSPAGMDNTIWNSSYPDIYWSINCPKDYFYAQTPYETSTDKYVGHDTFNLYHYGINDSVRFSVYDHDNLSRDDGLGYWDGSLEFLEKRPITRITFGNVKSFDVMIQKKGVVN